MPGADGELTPREAAHIATNVYFTLKDWINHEPTEGITPKAAVESRSVILNRVVGAGDIGLSQPEFNTSLRDLKMDSVKLRDVYHATTGLDTQSGFGYTLTYRASGKNHLVIAMRGTRPEMEGVPDIITDLRGAMTNFQSFGLVHKGFKKTFDSVLPQIAANSRLISDAHTIHCVGHSLGGGVATLIAAHCAGLGKQVKLYTFGSPRVGALSTYEAFHEAIGKENIYRVAHDLDPISLIAPFPYIHVNPHHKDENNITLPSPFGSLLSTQNHDMMEYIRTVQGLDWRGLRLLAKRVDQDDTVLARWLLHKDNDPGWVSRASAVTLSLLFRLFRNLLKDVSTSIFLGLSLVDFLAEVVMRGWARLKLLGERIISLLRYAAKWAGVQVREAGEFAVEAVRAILEKMIAELRILAARAFTSMLYAAVPVSIGIGGAWALSAYSIL